jgi:hypothetical protein
VIALAFLTRKDEENIMIQETIKPPVDTVPVKKEPSLRVLPIPEVVLEMTGTTKNLFNAVIAWWRALPKQRQFIIEMAGLSMALSLVATMVAILFARIFAKR